MRFAFFYGFLFSSDANFFRKATNGRAYLFLIVRFVRVSSDGRCVFGLSSGTLRGMTCNRCLATGMNGVSGATHPCRSEPARDSGLTFNIDVDCAGLIASRLAPTGIR